MSEQTATTFDTFAIVDLFGHAKIAGRVSEQVIAGTTMLRVDVPSVGDTPAFTRYYGGAAVYSITPVSEEIAKAAAERLQERPVTVWLPGNLLPAPEKEDGADGIDPYDDDEDDDEGPPF
jgi:hypothetical protein